MERLIIGYSTEGAKQDLGGVWYLIIFCKLTNARSVDCVWGKGVKVDYASETVRVRPR